MDMENIIEKRFKLFSPFLNEKQRRILAAIEAQILGYGGASRVAKTTGLSRNTVAAGALELERDKIEDIAPIKERIRKPGGGRKRTIQKDHTLKADLEQLIEPVTRGDPESALLWTCKSVRRLADELKKMGHETSHRMVAEMLGQMGYSLQANRKTIEGGSHPDRDAQFEYIHQRVKQFQKQRQPVISVDTKKKELVGNFKNQGREWRPKGSPEEVLVYDFESLGGGKITPYGVYDLSQNKGWVSVGVDKDTAAFAVESIRRWWKTMGHKVYPMAKRLLITADGGGSNGSRVRLCLAPAARNQQVEQDRASPVLPHQHELARNAAHRPRNDREPHRGDHDDRGPPRPRGARPRMLPEGHQDDLPLDRDDLHPQWNYTLRPQA